MGGLEIHILDFHKVPIGFARVSVKIKQGSFS